VTPMGHVLRGVAPEALFEGIEQGRAEAEAEHGVRLRWCTDIDGRGGPELALQTVELVLRHRPAGLVSLGLGGEEVPRAQFRRASRSPGTRACTVCRTRGRRPAHPLPRLIEEGLVVTLNSDDPPMFGTSLREEYLAVARILGLGPAGLRDLARNAARAAFLPQAEARALVAEIDSVSLPPPGPANGSRASE
jgi:aminodeoxyfutalosine deaminase